MADPVMKEREEPRFMSFSTGDVVDGILVLKEKVMIKEKPAIRYTVKVDDGDFVAFLGTHQLNTKLRITDIGHFVSIRCEGEDDGEARRELYEGFQGAGLREPGDRWGPLHQRRGYTVLKSGRRLPRVGLNWRRYGSDF